MKTLGLLRSRHLVAVAATAALFAAGCGGETTDITAAVDDTNKNLESSGATIDCPDEVDGGEGTEFECTLKGESGTTAPVKIKIIKDGLEPVKEADYVSALEKVTAPAE